MKSKIIYYFVGVVVGSAATYFVMNRRMKKCIDEEVAEVKEAYSNRKEVIGKVVKSEETDAGISFTVRTDPKVIAELNEQKKADLMANKEIINKQNYNLFSKPPQAKDIHNGIDENEDLDVYTEDYEEAVDTTPPKEGYAEKPYIISDWQFVNEEPYFDKISLDFYSDGTLANALSEEIIENVDTSIGKDIYDELKDHDEPVYVRNERYSVDYEIVSQGRPFVMFPEDDE